jgi:hypothetical protein
VRNHHILVGQLQPVRRARKQIHYRRFITDACPLTPVPFIHGLVRTHGPFAVTATVCSKCAE